MSSKRGKILAVANEGKVDPNPCTNGEDPEEVTGGGKRGLRRSEPCPGRLCEPCPGRLSPSPATTDPN